MTAVPSAPRITCGVSTCTSNSSAPGGRPWASSSLVHSRVIAVTWSAEVTFGSVTTNPGGSRPRASSSARNRSSVRIARWRVGRSRLLQRSPVNGGAAPRLVRQAGGRGPGVRVLVGAVVPVLEVQPEILDRLGGELGQHP